MKNVKLVVDVEKIIQDQHLSKADAITYIQGIKAIAPPKVMEPISE